MKASLRWACPDCLVRCVDVQAAMAHQERTGHGNPTLVVVNGRQR